MGFFDDIGRMFTPPKEIRNVLSGVAPFLSFVPGVGPYAAILASAMGKGFDKLNLGDVALMSLEAAGVDPKMAKLFNMTPKDMLAVQGLTGFGKPAAGKLSLSGVLGAMKGGMQNATLQGILNAQGTPDASLDRTYPALQRLVNLAGMTQDYLKNTDLGALDNEAIMRMKGITDESITDAMNNVNSKWASQGYLPATLDTERAITKASVAKGMLQALGTKGVDLLTTRPQRQMEMYNLAQGPMAGAFEGSLATDKAELDLAKMAADASAKIQSAMGPATSNNIPKGGGPGFATPNDAYGLLGGFSLPDENPISKMLGVSGVTYSSLDPYGWIKNIFGPNSLGAVTG